jgi:hypothetical protein
MATTQLREMTCDPKFRKVLVTDGKTRWARRSCARWSPPAPTSSGSATPSPGRSSPGFDDARGAARRSRWCRSTSPTRARCASSPARSAARSTSWSTTPSTTAPSASRIARHRRNRARRDGRQLLRPAAPRAGVRPALRARAPTAPSACAWVNLLSIYALANFPPHGTFSASKAAAHSLAQCLRAEMRPAGVRVVNVFPGPIDDEWNQLLPPPKVAPAALAKRHRQGAARRRRGRLPRRRRAGMARALARQPEGAARARIARRLDRHDPEHPADAFIAALPAHPRRRPHADAVARVPADRAAAGDGPVLAVPHRGGLALRRARPGLVLEQLLLRRAHRHPLRRADPLDLGPRPAEQRGRHDPARALHRPGLRDRLLEEAAPTRLPADRRLRLAWEARTAASRRAPGC